MLTISTVWLVCCLSCQFLQPYKNHAILTDMWRANLTVQIVCRSIYVRCFSDSFVEESKSSWLFEEYKRALSTYCRINLGDYLSLECKWIYFCQWKQKRIADICGGRKREYNSIYMYALCKKSGRLWIKRFEGTGYTWVAHLGAEGLFLDTIKPLHPN